MSGTTSSPLLSVIITAFNRRDSITDAVSSALAQSVEDLEVVVVDDASTDGTSEIVSSIKDPRIRLVQNATNRGIGGAKNVGIETSNGWYIAFLDSDDTWSPNKCALQISAIKKNNDIPLCFCAFYVTRQDKSRLLLRRPRRIGTWFDSILLGETTSLGSTLLAERNVFERVGIFTEAIKRMQDREWLIRYFDHYDDFIVLDEPLCTINNTSFPPPDMVVESIIRLREHCESRIARHGSSALSKFRAALEFEVGVAKFRAGSAMAMPGHILRAFSLHPPFALHMIRRLTRKLAQHDFS